MKRKNQSYLWIVVFLVVTLTVLNSFSLYMIETQIAGISRNLNSINTALNTPSRNIQLQAPEMVEKSIPIVAVSSGGTGVIGNLDVVLYPGDNDVLINTNPFLETDIQFSINKAVTVAKLMTNYEFEKDFVFDFSAGEAQLIGGESAGAASTIATIAALQNSELKADAVITGTINTDGSIGKVGGLLEKAEAVAEAGYEYFLIPEGQSTLTYYEKVVTKETNRWGYDYYRTRYVPTTLDLEEVAMEEWGLKVVEVSDIDEALEYF